MVFTECQKDNEALFFRIRIMEMRANSLDEMCCRNVADSIGYRENQPMQDIKVQRSTGYANE